MMKTCVTHFAAFIEDFNLSDHETGVCFNAVINFNLLKQNVSVESEVYMEAVFSNEIDTIHLLNPLIGEYKMPVRFNEGNHRFLHIENTGLLVAGVLPAFGSFTMTIFPQATACNLQTLREISCKKYN
ncbi:hypothetical protein BH11BAC3_BH11BAC3_46180 [soil metagenome]